MEQQQENIISKDSEKQSNKQKVYKPFIIKKNILKDVFKLESEQINKKHNLCKHPNGCISHCVDLSSSGFLMGYAAQAVGNLLLVLLRQRKDLISKPIQTITHILFNKDNFHFGMFPQVQQILLQSIHCLLRRYRNKEDGINAFVAGFISGISLLLVKKGFRQVWAMYLLVRSLECCLNSLIERKIVPKSQFNWLIIFSCMWILQAYNMSFEPRNCPNSFLKFAVKSMDEDIADTTFRKAWIAKKNLELFTSQNIKPVDADNKLFIGEPAKQVKIFSFQK